MQRITLDSEISYVVTEKELKEIRAKEREKIIDRILNCVALPKPAEKLIEEMKGGVE